MRYYKRYYPRCWDFGFEKKAGSFNFGIKDFPLLLQIQTVNSCNGSCLMCPSKDQKKTFELMPNEIFDKLINELRSSKKSLYLVLMLQNEPFLDKDIFQKARSIKEATNNNIFISVITNGSLLKNYDLNLFKETALDRVYISLDAYHEITYKKIRGKNLDFKNIKKKIDELISRGLNHKIAVRLVVQKDNFDEANQFFNYWKNKEVGVEIMNLENRCGLVKDYKKLRIKDCGISNIKKCFEPFNNLCVTVNGDVIPCCSDWSHENIMGNIKNNSIQEIWTNKKFEYFRLCHTEGKAQDIEPCKFCSQLQNQ
jgi:radical SAM protein with 4Fe4S-binding SPASM domain